MLFSRLSEEQKWKFEQKTENLKFQDAAACDVIYFDYRCHGNQ